MFLLPEYDRGFAIFINQNGFLHNFTSYQDLNHGLVNLLAGETTSQSLSMQQLGLILFIAMLASIAMSAKTLIGVLQRRDIVYTPVSQILLGIAVDLMPLLLLTLLPRIVWILLGRIASYKQLFLIFPEIMIWLCVLAVIHTIKVCVKSYRQVQRYRIVKQL